MTTPSITARRGGRGVFALGVLLGTGALGVACSGDDETPAAPRAVTTSELVGLVRSNVVTIAMSEVRAGKAFETSKAWADAEIDRIDCELG